MDRFFSLLQITTSCYKLSKIWLGFGFVGCTPGHRSWSLVVLFVHKWHLIRYWVWKRLFADDCVYYHEIKDEEDTMKLQSDIVQLGSWARKWGMRFQLSNAIWCSWQENGSRRSILHIPHTSEGTDLENVESIKYLGVTITSDLRWNTHVSNVCTKANRTLGFLRRNLYSCPQEVKEAAYKGLVCPVQDYGSSVWDPPGVVLQEELESALRKRLRIQSVISVNYHYITVLCPFNLLIHFKCYNTV